MAIHERLEDIPLWDATDYLTTPERIAGYIEAVLEEDDPALLAKAIGDVACASGRPGPSSDRLHDQLDTLMGVLRPLGLRLVVRPTGAQSQWADQSPLP